MKLVFLCIVFGLTTVPRASTGGLSGKVVDSDTHQPLVGANVMVVGTDIGTSCDAEGVFSISNIPVGGYTVTASMIGYSPASRANVNIYSQRQTQLKFNLSLSVLEGKLITVSAGFFEKAKDGVVSTQTIGIEEIRSDPIGSYDIQMMVHSLPSVVTATDQNNEIIVRGGGPGENLFIVDNLEIPNPNHFGEVGTGGGPVNILNTEFVEKVDFFAGGFPARYGDKQSSVMDISLREGNYNNFNLDMEMSMAGAGLLAEGPYANGRGSYLASFRQSFLKYIIKSSGLTAVPEYWNSQLKAVYNLSRRDKLTFNAVGGWDHIKVEDENRPDLKGAENVERSGYQYTAGITYKSLFSKNGYTLLSGGRTSSGWVVDVYSIQDNSEDTYFTRDNIETDNFIKWDVVYKHSKNFELSAGINTKYGSYNMREVLDPDTVYFYTYPDLQMDANLQDYYALIGDRLDYEYYAIPEPATGDTLINKGRAVDNSGGLWRYASYGQIRWTKNRLTLTSGLRFDSVPKNKTSVVAPRLGLSLSLTPATKLNAAVGKYYQTPFYMMLLNPNSPRTLKHSHTDQRVLGVEYLFADDIKATIEIYSKDYYNRPVKISTITSDSLDGRLGFTDSGRGRSRGVELFIQKKFSHKWYGTLSYAHSRAEGLDVREGREGYYPWDFDFVNTFTLVGGYKFKFRESLWYNRIREARIFPYIAWIPFMVSDQLEISFRYRYSGGRPYTPKKYDFHHRIWYLDPNDNLNTERYGPYSRLDIMVLRRFNFKKINLTTYLDLQNIFDRNNQWERVYLEDGTYEMSYQYKQLPVGGIIIEF